MIEYEIKRPGVRSCVVAEYARHIELKRLFVFDAWQGRGVGSAVIRQLQAIGKTIYLYAVPSDPSRWADLERFYRGHGFTEDFFDNARMVWKPGKKK